MQQSQNPSVKIPADPGRPAHSWTSLVRKYTWLLALGWTLAVGASLAWNLAQQAKNVELLALETARSLLRKDSLYEQWSAMHGRNDGPVAPPAGSNPPVQPTQPPVASPTGPPPASTNRVDLAPPRSDLQDLDLGVRGHYTSLKPTFPKNAPDPWERQALEKLKKGSREVSAIEVLENRRHLRLIQPAVIEASCLACHGDEDYKVGDLRGGISVTLPLQRFEALSSSRRLALIHGGFWLLGLAALLWGARRWQGVIRERQQAEEALRDSEARYRTLVETAQDIIYIINREFRVEYINEYGARQFGRSMGEIAGRHLTELFPPETTQWQLPDMAGIFRTGEPLHRERHLPFGRQPMWLDTRLVPVKNATGEVESILGISRDITERKGAEEERKKITREIELLLASTGEGIYGLDLEGRCTLINRAGAEMFGWKPDELFGQNIHELAHHHKADGSPYPVEECAIIRTLRKGESMRVNTEVFWRQDGTSFPVEYASFPIFDGGKITGAVVSFTNISERKLAEQQLRDSAALYHSLVENLPQHVFRKDLAGRFTFGNGPFCQSLGQPLAEILGKSDPDFCPPALAGKYRKDDQRVIETGQPFACDEEHRQASGKTIFVHVIKTPLRDAAGQIIGVQGISWDITERRQIERQMQRTDRLESIGTLAGGIAHDLNNALAPIMMAGELLRLEFPDTAAHYLERIQASAKRGASMVKQLLTFAKGAAGERLLLQPRHLLKEMEQLINSTFLKSITLRTRYPKDLWPLRGDATQLHQVLLNLCINARDAMPNGGALTLEGENKELDAAFAGTVPEAKPGHYVVWRVTDTGTGIPPEVLDRIFEPFFTTKSPDKGTGLGLSTTLGIVKGHGGFIHVYSTPGQGSTFAVYLPAYGAGADAADLVTKVETNFRGHGETILVVDDEAVLCDTLRDVLTALNFKVLTASDGTAALLQVLERQAELRAVITDMHMPHMDGLAFVRVLQSRLPQIGIIVVSGRLDERETAEFQKLGVTALVQKPFTQEKLVEVLRTIFQT